MDKIVHLVLLYCLLGVDKVVSESSGDHPLSSPLYFGVFLSQGTNFDFSGVIPPLELGVRTINDDQTILKGLNGMNYLIEYEPISDSKVCSYKYM